MGTEYNAELTFTPKLNEASVKLVESTTSKWRERSQEYRKSRERALVAEANAAFTFHPEMNSRSQKIMTMRRKYSDTKPSEIQLSFENREEDCAITPVSDLNMDSSSREISFESASIHVTKEAETFIQEVISCTEEEIEVASRESEHNLKTNSDFHSFPENDIEKPSPIEHGYKVPARRVISLPYHNTDYLYKIKAAKEAALSAIRLKRTFTILGPYPYLRRSLCKRGWVEKFEEHSCQSILGTPQPIRHRLPKKRKKFNNTAKTSSSDSDESSDSDDSDFKNDPDFNRIVSRLLKDISPTFIWTIKRDDIDFKYLNREQIVNHYCKASSFTTKIGLCHHLRSLPWFDVSDPHEFFPRCYQLYNEDDRDDFTENFEICASLSILKIYMNQHKDNILFESMESVSTAEKDDIPVEKADHVVSTEAISLSIFHLKHIIRYYNNEFLDNAPEPKDVLTAFKRKSILGYSYSLTARDFKFKDFSQELFDSCDEIVQIFEGLNFTQNNIEGFTNTWIMKPGAKSRGRGVIPQNNLDEIFKLADNSKEEKWVIQKYIERPLLVHETKFDIRQWFMVTDWNPLVLFFYQDSYLRFGSKPFTLDDFDPSIHLCNNSIQKKFMSGNEKNSTRFAQGNMWTSSAFKKHISKLGKLHLWDELIYPGMKKAIQRVMMTIQDIIEDRKNSFELYGADFMLDSSYNPWLIEINCSPAMGGTTKVTERLCSEVMDDCVKVIIDRKDNRNAATGKWELIYKQPVVSVPPYIGVQLSIEGKYLPKPIIRRKHREADADGEHVKRSPRSTKLPPDTTPRKPAVQKQELRSSKIVGITIDDAASFKEQQICGSIICRHTEKYKKELYSSLSLNPPTKLNVDCLVTQVLHCPTQQNTMLASGSASTGTLPNIISNDIRHSPHLSTLSISPVSSIQTDDKWTIRHSLQSSSGTVSTLIPTNINPYRLQQIISRQAKPRQLDMLTLQNKYSHQVSFNSVIDIKQKRRKMKKVSKIKSLSKLSTCPHCDTKNQKGIILNLLKSPCGGTLLPKKEPSTAQQSQRPKKHFRVSLSQVASMSHKVVDIQQKGGSILKVVGEQTSS